MHRQLWRHAALVILVLSLFSKAVALIPEGLEGFILKNGRLENSRIDFSAQNTDFIWYSQGPSATARVEIPTSDKNLFMLGYLQTTNSLTRYAYFLRYDYTISNSQSIAIKWLHNAWEYIPAIQENISLEYNGFFIINSLGTGAYYDIGLFQRWLKQSWNSNFQNPFSLVTDDKSAFLLATFGLIFHLSSNSRFLTIDINNRDTFNYYNGDFIGSDLSIYLALSKNQFLKIWLGSRWSGFFTYLPGFPTTNYWGIGIYF